MMTTFEHRILLALKPQLKALGVPMPAMAAFVAQISAETANGTSKNVRVRHNFAGIRGGKKWIRPGNLLGYTIYANDAAGIAGYLDLVRRKYPQFIETAKMAGTASAVAIAMGRSRWAATHYRRGADGTDDAAGDRGVILGKVGTEGFALFPAIRRILADPDYPST